MYKDKIEKLQKQERKLIHDMDNLLSERSDDDGLKGTDLEQFEKMNEELTGIQRQRAAYETQNKNLDYQNSSDTPASLPQDRGSSNTNSDITYRDYRDIEKTLTPGSERYMYATEEYRKAFEQYVKHHDTGPLMRTMQVVPNASGGFLLPIQMGEAFIQSLQKQSVIRNLARVERVQNAREFEVPAHLTRLENAEWTDEVPASDIGDLNTHTLSRIKFNLRQLARGTSISAFLQNQAPGDVINEVLNELSLIVSRTEENAFTNGLGEQMGSPNQPEGLFANTSINTIDSSSTTGLGSATDLISAFQELRPVYQQNATWLCSSQFLGQVRSLEASSGPLVWRQTIAESNPETILGRPVVISEFINSDFSTAGNDMAIIGDIFSTYMIAESTQRALLRKEEPLKGRIGFGLFSWLDAKVVLPEASQKIVVGS